MEEDFEWAGRCIGGISLVAAGAIFKKGLEKRGMKRGMWEGERGIVGVLAVVDAGGLVERIRNVRGGGLAPWGASGQNLTSWP